MAEGDVDAKGRETNGGKTGTTQKSEMDLQPEVDIK